MNDGITDRLMTAAKGYVNPKVSIEAIGSVNHKGRNPLYAFAAPSETEKP